MKVCDLIMQLREENFGSNEEIAVEVRLRIPGTKTSRQSVEKTYWAKRNLKAHKESSCRRAKNYLAKLGNRDKQRALHKAWSKSPEGRIVLNKWKRSETHKKSRREQYKNNPEVKLGAVLRARLQMALKGTAKAASTMELVGCTIQELKSYLENQFKFGMTWNNHGEWHVDHIRPCVSFDLTDPDQQRRCFHYSNLQPLWAKDNQTKGSKL